MVLNPQKQLKREREARFQSIYYAHYEHMLRYAKSIFANRGIPDPGDGRAEESVQEAFLHAWEHCDEMFSVPNPEGWLFKVLFYKVLSRIRSDTRWARAIQFHEHLSANIADQFDFDSGNIQSIVDEEDYILLKKLYVEGYSYHEICTEHNLTKAALGCRIHRIKKKIIAQLMEP